MAITTTTQTAESARTGDVQTLLNYYLEVVDGGTTAVQGGTAEAFLRKHNSKTTTIRDIRDAPQDKFGLETSGFQLVHAPTKFDMTEVADNKEAFDELANVETVELLKRLTGASIVKVFSSSFRRCRSTDALTAARSAADKKDMIPIMTPLQYCHVDQSYAGAAVAMRGALTSENSTEADTAELECLLQQRWAIINVWRPLKQVHRDPLAVCDSRTVSDDDLRAVKMLPPSASDRAKLGATFKVSASAVSENWNVAYSPKHEWWYASEMTPSEVLVFKNYDSRDDGSVARRVPHSAFEFFGQDDSANPRESVELRAFVAWDEK